ncbi:MAG: hypothetical protein ACLQG5_13865 [Methanobacterium sp.]|jgi:arabinofuranosyltransferase
MELNTKNICIVGIFVSVILFILMLVYVNFTIDDAFISFRYSEHLISGFGLVWNIGQSPVEGYSNFLWVLMIAVLFLFKLNPIVSTKVMGLLSVFGIIVLFWFISNDFFKNKKNKYIAFSVSTVFLLINPYTAIHAVSGLETMFYAFLLLGVVYSTWKIITFTNSKFIWVFAFLALLLSLTRPEGILISVALIFSIIYISYKKNNNLINLTSFLPVLIVYLIPIISYQVFRILYFHELFPLPFLVKIIYGYTNPMESLYALIYIIPFIIIVLISLHFRNQMVLRQENQRKNDFRYFLLILSVAFLFASIAYIYTPIIDYGQRFFYPSFVMIYAAFGIAISILFNELVKNKPNLKLENKNKIIFSVILVVLLVFANFNGISDFKEIHGFGVILEKSNIPIGKALSPFADDNYTIASIDAGAVPYYSGWNDLDLGGLNDKFIAQNGYISTDYLEQKNPELVLLVLVNGEVFPQNVYDYLLDNNYTQLDSIDGTIPFLKLNIKDYNLIKNSLETVGEETNS